MEGITLDNFAELKAVEGLKEGSLIKVGLTISNAKQKLRQVDYHWTGEGVG